MNTGYSEQPKAQLEPRLPSFSMILETENLANADLNDLTQSLASIANQDLSPAIANEVWLIDSGDAPDGLLQQLCAKYPWIKVHRATSGIGYYDSKMLGAAIATGDIIVYCDSDCFYESDWLRNLLTAFAQDSSIHVVAGETITRGKGAYGVAMALNYIFPRYSNQQTLRKAARYFLNNVAFRRSFLLENPIPTDLPLYRGNCSIHAQLLKQQGHVIWRHPQARATHAPPEGVAHFFWRFLLMGRDHHLTEQLSAELEQQFRMNQAAIAQSPSQSSSQNPSSSGSKAVSNSRSKGVMARVSGKVGTLYGRLKMLMQDEPQRLIYLPLALPISLASMTLILVGRVITTYKPDYLLKRYERYENGSKPAADETLSVAVTAK